MARKVCHITSAHNPYDVRIFVKECRSLVRAGYDVSLVIHGQSEIKDGVNIVGLGEKPTSRFRRMLGGSRRAARTALNIPADVFHLHDPEMLLHARKLKKTGAKVVFDSHENVSAQILAKYWIPKGIRSVVSKVYRAFETRQLKYVDSVVAATPFIADQFHGRVKDVVVVNNYPLLDDIVFHKTSFEERGPNLCYVGGISEIRGEKVITEAMEGVEGVLHLAGSRADETEPVDMSNVLYDGFLDRERVNELYGKCVAGLVVLLPEQGYVVSKPVKMYEYMAAGLPVIASDFPLWRELIEESRCGICVSPLDSESIKKAIIFLLSNRATAQEYGKNGRKLVVEKYNWQCEEKKLFALYERLLTVQPAVEQD